MVINNPETKVKNKLKLDVNNAKKIKKIYIDIYTCKCSKTFVQHTFIIMNVHLIIINNL